MECSHMWQLAKSSSESFPAAIFDANPDDADISYASLLDGEYKLTVNHSDVSGISGFTSNQSFTFHRLYGDYLVTGTVCPGILASEELADCISRRNGYRARCTDSAFYKGDTSDPTPGQ